VPKLKIGILFGSRSVEHEVSIITAHQVMETIDPDRYEIVPIYITKEGHWYTGDNLRRLENFQDLQKAVAQAEKVYIAPDPSVRSLVREAKSWWPKKTPLEIDVAFPLFHGTFGEDGTIQGLLELADIPYVGPGVLGSALGMDKIAMKAVFRENQMPIVNYIWFSQEQWQNRPAEILKQIETQLPYPLFVKPANLGSSIGISKAKDRESLSYAIEVASHYDRRLLVEESVEGAIEVNCSVRGNVGQEDPIPSVCEQPISWEEFLNYDEKYLRGEKAAGMKGTERRIPAPIPPELTEKIQKYSVKAFQALDCWGVARVDFLVRMEKKEIFINEINTIPGSLSFYLWEATGLKFRELIDQLIAGAQDAHQKKKRINYSYDSKLVTQFKKDSMKFREK
jgi:D-alanine-D-alanine ligase